QPAQRRALGRLRGRPAPPWAALVARPGRHRLPGAGSRDGADRGRGPAARAARRRRVPAHPQVPDRAARPGVARLRLRLRGLPAYHVLGAAVLSVFGLWNLVALKAANVGLAVLTLAAVLQLAGSQRRGRVAVFLLATNPVFLLTAGSVVAEPLLTLELTAAA